MGNLNEQRASSGPSRGLIYIFSLLFLTSFALLIAPRIATLSLAVWASESFETVRSTQTSTIISAASNPDAHQVLKESLVILRSILKDIAGEDQESPKRNDQHTDPLSTRDLASAFEGIFTGIAGDLVNDISGASKYVGIGIGSGTLQGLGVDPAFLKTNTAIPKASGINAAAQSLGNGLFASMVGSINLKALLPSMDSMGPASRALSQGLGSGAAAGLMLKEMDTAAFNDTGMSGIAGNIGQGLSSSFFGGVNVMKMMSPLGGSMSGEMNQAVLSLAQGLGSGAASALKLTTTPASNASFNSGGISGIAGNLGQGLSTSFLQNVDLSTTLSKATNGVSGSSILSAAQGLGSGLGGGVVIGLGLQPADQNAPTDGTSPDIKTVVQTFAKGLTSQFLSNGTLSKLTQLIAGGKSQKFDISKVAAGLAVGLVDGAQQSVENAGGVVGLLNMPDAAGTMKMPVTSEVDDGVGGLALGFGSGLGFEATKGLLQAFGRPPLASANSTSEASVTSKGVMLDISPIQKRSATLVAYKQEMVMAKLDSMMLAATLDPILQMGSSTLGCQGIGGLASILHALQGSNGLSGGKLENLTMALGSLTNETLTVTDGPGGNTFNINVAQNMITVNGNTLSTEINLTIAHITLAITAWLIGIPLMLALSSLRGFALMTGRPQILASAPRSQIVIGTTVVLPSVIATFAIGIIGEGKRSHFRSAHGIVALLLVIFTLFSMVLFRLRNNSSNLSLAHNLNLTLVIILTVATVLTGFVDLSTISSCFFQWVPQVAFVAAGFFLSIPLFSAATMALVLLALQKLDVNRRLERLLEVQNDKVPDGDNGTMGGQEWGEMYAQTTTITRLSHEVP